MEKICLEIYPIQKLDLSGLAYNLIHFSWTKTGFVPCCIKQFLRKRFFKNSIINHRFVGQGNSIEL